MFEKEIQVGIGTAGLVPVQIELSNDNPSHADINNNKFLPPCSMGRRRHYTMVSLRNLSKQWTELKIASISVSELLTYNNLLVTMNMDEAFSRFVTIMEYNPFEKSVIYKRALKPLDDDMFEINGQILFESGSQKVPIFKTDGGKVEVYIRFYDW